MQNEVFMLTVKQNTKGVISHKRTYASHHSLRFSCSMSFIHVSSDNCIVVK